MSFRHRDWKRLRKAEVLGFPTEEIADHWLIPVALKTKRPSPRPRSGARIKFGTSVFRETYKVTPPSGDWRNARHKSQAVGLPPVPNKNILTVHPLPRGADKLQTRNAHPKRSHFGRLAKKGTKQAALARAESGNGDRKVPFQDALNAIPKESKVAGVESLLEHYFFKGNLDVAQLDDVLTTIQLESDPIMMKGSAFLLKHGFFFSMIKVSYVNDELHPRLLKDMKLLLEIEDEKQRHGDSWFWHATDRELFIKQFRRLPITTHYKHVRRQLLAMEDKGIHALFRIEREMLMKVVDDFLNHVDDGHGPLQPTPPCCVIDADAIPLAHSTGLQPLRESVGTQTPPENSNPSCVHVVLNVHPDPVETSASPLSTCLPAVEEREDGIGEIEKVDLVETVGSGAHPNGSSHDPSLQAGKEGLGEDGHHESFVDSSTNIARPSVLTKPDEGSLGVGGDLECEDEDLKPSMITTANDEEQNSDGVSTCNSGSDDESYLSMLSFRNRDVGIAPEKEDYHQEISDAGDASSEVSLLVGCADDGVSLAIRPRGATAQGKANRSAEESSTSRCEKISMVLLAKDGGVKVSFVLGACADESKGEVSGDENAPSSTEAKDPGTGLGIEKWDSAVYESPCGRSVPEPVPSAPNSQSYPSDLQTASHLFLEETDTKAPTIQNEIRVKLLVSENGVSVVLSPKKMISQTSAEVDEPVAAEERIEEIVSLEKSTLTEKVSLRLLPRHTPTTRQEEPLTFVGGTGPSPCDGNVTVKLIPSEETVSVHMRFEESHEGRSPATLNDFVADEVEDISVELVIQEEKFLLFLDPQYPPSSSQLGNASFEEKVAVKLSLVDDRVSIAMAPHVPEDTAQVLGNDWEQVTARLTQDESVSVILTPPPKANPTDCALSGDSQISECVHLELTCMAQGVAVEIQPQHNTNDMLLPSLATRRQSNGEEMSVQLDVEEVFSLVLNPQLQLASGQRERAQIKVEMGGVQVLPNIDQGSIISLESLSEGAHNEEEVVCETKEGDGVDPTIGDKMSSKDPKVHRDNTNEGPSKVSEPQAGSIEPDVEEAEPLPCFQAVPKADSYNTVDLEEPCASGHLHLLEELAIVEMRQEEEFMKVTNRVVTSGAESACSLLEQRDCNFVASSADHPIGGVRVHLSIDGETCSLFLDTNTQASSSGKFLGPTCEDNESNDDEEEDVNVAQLKREAETLEAEIDKERRTLQEEKKKLEEHLVILMKVMDEQKEAESRASTPGNLQQLEAERLSLMQEIEQEKECLAAIVESLANSVISPRRDDNPDAHKVNLQGRNSERIEESTSWAVSSPQCAAPPASGAPLPSENVLSSPPREEDTSDENQFQRTTSGECASCSKQNSVDDPDDQGHGKTKPTSQEDKYSNENVTDTDQSLTSPMKGSPSQKNTTNLCEDSADKCQEFEKTAASTKTPESSAKEKSTSPASSSSCEPISSIEASTARVREETQASPEKLGADTVQSGALHDARKEEDCDNPISPAHKGEDSGTLSIARSEVGSENMHHDENLQPATRPELDDAEKDRHASPNSKMEDNTKGCGIQESLNAFQEQLAQTQQIAAVLQAYQPDTRQSDGHKSRGGSPTRIQVTPEDAKKLALLSEELKKSPDFDEPPTKEEVNKFAVYLGMDPEEDKEFLYIAEWALTAPLPAGWTVHLDSQGNEFYFNTVTKVSQYGHPMDGKYKELYQKLKYEKLSEDKDQVAQ